VNYNESTALVITFVVNNHVDESQNEKARAWEKGFLDFMKNFYDPDMIIAYSAEVRPSHPHGLTSTSFCYFYKSKFWFGRGYFITRN
jgi:hypothetical protein